MLKIKKRDEPWKWGALVVFLGALLFSLLVSGLLLAGQGKDPMQGLAVLWQGSFGSVWGLGDVLLKSIPLFLCSLGVAVAFRMQIWNIGAEGQFALGAIGATWMALSFPDLPRIVLMPLMFGMAFILGGIWAMIPALLKLKLRVNEIISTLMLNYIAILFLDYLVFGVWKDPASFGFPMTPEFSANAVIPAIAGGRVHWGIVFCAVVGVGLWAFMRFTRLGFELQASGEGARVAKYAKIRYGMLVLFVMGLSGGFAGWAGCVETSAVLNRLQPSLMVGYGYTAIVVAWLARLEPLNIAFASILLAALRVGVESLQIRLQVPAAFGVIMEGMILLTVLAGQFFLTYKLGRGTKQE
ncbi:MAG: ABC transporter permease [Pseudodesulfovibrio sp.]|uniref:Branched-chain amino acid ABC transporter permease n=1 Tax=Pseudodesulfovibrio indicus TaxID=1716143 RepID=A0A126QNK8_9BACT|nr:ABC transporter permease [Pseudodesulfovibrio indicus]AMK11680.1 branched-chain amino acid ABC transporter permease [Pseudodesulfovibrio indicus]TDT88208.1 nucleoside ABC transporter membrane protein [Pseudodesulfovibrio indicus]